MKNPDNFEWKYSSSSELKWKIFQKVEKIDKKSIPSNITKGKIKKNKSTKSISRIKE